MGGLRQASVRRTDAVGQPSQRHEMPPATKLAWRRRHDLIRRQGWTGRHHQRGLVVGVGVEQLDRSHTGGRDHHSRAIPSVLPQPHVPDNITRLTLAWRTCSRPREATHRLFAEIRLGTQIGNSVRNTDLVATHFVTVRGIRDAHRDPYGVVKIDCFRAPRAFRRWFSAVVNVSMARLIHNEDDDSISIH